MKKYIPSITRNNELKDEFIKNINALLYKSNKGKMHSHLDVDSIKVIFNGVEEALTNLDNAIGTGKENIYDIYLAANQKAKELERKLNQELVSQVEESADELLYTIESWQEVLNGSIEFDAEEFQKAKTTWSIKKLNSRLSELDSIKFEFEKNEKRLEKDIVLLEKEASEVDQMIIDGDNERRLNELYRKITTINSKKDSLNVRRSNYSACANLLDLIYANAKEILSASEFNDTDLGKAKAFMNLNKLRNVLSEPDKAIAILSRMEKDINEILEKTRLIDSKILKVDTKTTNVSSEALAYKEELLKRKREKESLSDLDKNSSTVIEEPKKVEGEN